MLFRSISMALIVAFMGFTLPVSDAEAKRLGGGMSFGGKKSFSSPQKRSATGDQGKAGQNATGNSAAAGAGAAGTAGRAAGMGGILGGLVAGGLLGALFFGGAFENINFMDILIFGLLAFLLFKFLARRKPQSAYAGAPGFDESAQYRTAEKEIGGGIDEGRASRFVSRFTSSSSDRPKDFDENKFVENAKSAFTMLQTAWDSGDLSEVRGYTTDSVFAEIQDQFRSRSGKNETEIMNLDARVLEVVDTGNDIEASVMFTAQLREIDENSGVYPEPVHVEEIWHFVKPKKSINPTWFLDGIQQVED